MRTGTMLLGATALALVLSAPAFAQSSGSASRIPEANQSTPSNATTTAPSTTGQATRTQSGTAATSVSNPETTFASRPVQDSLGKEVGRVKDVQTDMRGQADKVTVGLTAAGSAQKAVAIPASDLRYDSNARVLKASLTLSQINQLPVAEKTGEQKPAREQKRDSEPQDTTKGPY
ncbi:MAG: hypothetical protein ACT4OG_07810 [Alphaproteobacteria bacterium]